MTALRKSATKCDETGVANCAKAPNHEAVGVELAAFYVQAAEPMNRLPSQFWEERKDSFPLLYPVAARLPIIPATSASAERLFSKTGTVMDNKRPRLGPAVLNKIMMVRYNGA
eukprot:GEMP01065787.1.p2 GENE.GEMP01065787.1~~GEMP01065787.1.p2  ORF type:complete len:113 (+),score=27.96 GEMP01065787.1:880-1218(+)